MAKQSPRSAAVTAAATLALLGCSAAFLLWGYFFLSLVNGPPDENGHHFYQLYPKAFVLIALVPSCVIAIGIRIGIGLFQLRPWARTLAMVWAAIALVLCLGLIAFRPFETFFIPEHFVGPTESLKQLIAVGVVILLLPVSVWWLFLFRMKGVKAQFEAEEGARERDEEDVPVTSEV